MFSKVPLAWRNLTYDVRRLAVAVAGVGFAVLLIFVELGFLNALLDSTVEVVQRMNGDLIMVNKGRFAMLARHRFDESRLQQAAAIPGVSDTYPLYIEDSAIMRQEGRPGYPIRVFAFDEERPALQIAALQTGRGRLSEPYAAMVDAKSAPKYGFPPAPAPVDEYRGELASREVHIVDRFDLGRDFANDGNVILNLSNFAACFPKRTMDDDPLSSVDVGLIQLTEPQTAEAIRDRLNRELPRDVTVFTKQEFLDREKHFWRTRTPVGAIFSVGVGIGFIVGVTICYQIIYSSVADHMPEFATLKAMGYKDFFFVRVVLGKTFYLSLLGYVPGAIVSFALYRALAASTGLMMQFKPSVAATVFVFTLAMCTVSGLFVIRKLKSADPAELF